MLENARSGAQKPPCKATTVNTCHHFRNAATFQLELIITTQARL